MESQVPFLNIFKFDNPRLCDHIDPLHRHGHPPYSNEIAGRNYVVHVCEEAVG